MASTLFFFQPKIMPRGQNPLDERWRHPSCTCVKNFCTSRSCQFQAVTPKVQTCSAYSLDFHFHTRLPNASSRDVASSFTKGLVILNLKPSNRFSRALVMMSWVKHRSRSDITSSNIAALKWRTRQAIHKLKRGADWEGSANSEFHFNGGFVHAKSVSENCPRILPI